jgi:hypothetical protein
VRLGHRPGQEPVSGGLQRPSERRGCHRDARARHVQRRHGPGNTLGREQILSCGSVPACVVECPARRSAGGFRACDVDGRAQLAGTSSMVSRANALVTLSGETAAPAPPTLAPAAAAPPLASPARRAPASPQALGPTCHPAAVQRLHHQARCRITTRRLHLPTRRPGVDAKWMTGRHQIEMAQQVCSAMGIRC